MDKASSCSGTATKSTPSPLVHPPREPTLRASSRPSSLKTMASSAPPLAPSSASRMDPSWSGIHPTRSFGPSHLLLAPFQCVSPYRSLHPSCPEQLSMLHFCLLKPSDPVHTSWIHSLLLAVYCVWFHWHHACLDSRRRLSLAGRVSSHCQHLAPMETTPVPASADICSRTCLSSFTSLHLGNHCSVHVKLIVLWPRIGCNRRSPIATVRCLLHIVMARHQHTVDTAMPGWLCLHDAFPPTAVVCNSEGHTRRLQL